jgi:hypothetical protein
MLAIELRSRAQRSPAHIKFAGVVERLFAGSKDEPLAVPLACAELSALPLHQTAGDLTARAADC